MKKLILGLALALYAAPALAQSCAASLTPAFTGAQAQLLCSRLGTLAVLGQPASNFEVVAGAGTNQATGAALSGTRFVHQLTGANGTVGWRLPAVTVANRNQVHFFLNTTAGIANLYPETGGTINGLAANAVFAAATGVKPIVCVVTGAATWICS